MFRNSSMTVEDEEETEAPIEEKLFTFFNLRVSFKLGRDQAAGVIEG